MAFEEFKNFCPECGERMALIKAPNGNFRCPACGCEYRRNWRTWILLGIPAIAWGVFLLGSLPGVGFWKAPLGAVLLSGAVMVVLFWTWGHRDYRIMEHGRESVDPGDEGSVR